MLLLFLLRRGSQTTTRKQKVGQLVKGVFGRGYIVPIKLPHRRNDMPVRVGLLVVCWWYGMHVPPARISTDPG